MTPSDDRSWRYAVLGNPVAHSRSPFIHEAFARSLGLPIVYERVLSPLDAFEATVRAFAAGGGRGANVTMPFKFQVPRLAARCSARAQLAGAANVLKFDGAPGHGAGDDRRDEAHWYADNTDGIGLVRDIEGGAGVALRGRSVLLLGAGGAAAGALGPLIEARPARVVISNRSVDKAHALSASHAEWADRHGVLLAATSFEQAGEGAGEGAGEKGSGGFDVLVNATSASLAGATLPLPPTVLAPGALALDMMYGAPAEPFLRWARAAGATARDGLGMLVEQAAEAFLVFRGQRPLAAPVLAALRRQIEQEQQAARAASTAQAGAR
jgi:shikimate dehydrogenase